MQLKPDTISLQSIDHGDRTYKVTVDRPFDDILVTIREVGLLSPPILKPKSGKYTIISGFRRVSACRHLGWSGLEARITAPDAGSLECLRLAIADNAANRRLNLVEQSIALSRLSSYYQDDDELSRVSANLGMPVAPSLIPKLRRLCLLPQRLQDGVLSDTISLTVALELGAIDTPSAVALVELFERLKPTLNHQKKILTLAREISLIENVSISCLLREDFLREILHHPDMNRNQKVRGLIDVLRKKRYPVITRFEDRFEGMVRSLGLPGTIRIIPPKHFEGGAYAIILNFQTLPELKAQMDLLAAALHRPEFEGLLTKEIADH